MRTKAKSNQFYVLYSTEAKLLQDAVNEVSLCALLCLNAHVGNDENKQSTI